MYLFSVIKDYLIEPNTLIANIAIAPMIFLGMYINLLLFKQLLSLEVSKKQTYQYIIFTGLWTIFCNIFINNPLGLFFNCIILPRNCYVDIQNKIYKISFHSAYTNGNSTII